MAVAREDELVPAGPMLMAADAQAEAALGRNADRLAVLLGCGRVAQRLPRQVAAVADEVPEQHEVVAGPALGCGRLRDAACECHAIAWTQLPQALPPGAGPHTVVRRGGQGSPRGEAQPVHEAPADAPDPIAARHSDPVAGVDRKHLGLRAHEVADRHTPPIREEHRGVPGHALTQVRQHRPLVRARLDAAAELGQGDDRDGELARQDLEAAAHLADLLHAVLDARVGAHELEVVDDDQAQAAVLGHRLLVQAARLGADVEDPDVDESST
jgi:hypothetical protein